MTGVNLVGRTITLDVGSTLTIDPTSTLQVLGGNPQGPVLPLPGSAIVLSGVVMSHQTIDRDAIRWGHLDISSGGGSVQLGVVPEPGSMMLLLAGLATAGLTRMARRG